MSRIDKLILTAALLGLAAVPTIAHAEIRVVATLPTLAAVAKEVGGELVSVRSMALPTQDAHFVDAKPHLALQLSKADLVLAVGLELEVGWLPTLLVGARNAAIQTGARGYLDCSQFVQPLDVARRPVDRGMGDIHPAGNPHYLTDPRAAVAVAAGIAGRLAELDPAHAAAYQRQLAAFLQRLDLARKRWEATMAPHRGAPVIEYHKTLAYLAQWLGLQVVGAVEPKPGIPPNPSHVAQLLARARLQKIQAVIQEEYYPDATSRLLADKIPATLVRIPGGANLQGGEDYIHYLGEVIRRMSAGLGAKGGG